MHVVKFASLTGPFRFHMSCRIEFLTKGIPRQDPREYFEHSAGKFLTSKKQ